MRSVETNRTAAYQALALILIIQHAGMHRQCLFGGLRIGLYEPGMPSCSCHKVTCCNLPWLFDGINTAQ